MTQIRYIKLGEKGKWEKSCIEEDSTLRIWYESGHHEECLRGDWEPVYEFFLNDRNGSRSAASNDIRQIQDFYALDEETIWITFYQRRLYWCRAASKVRELEDKSRVRDAIGGWSDKDLKGAPLTIETLDGRVTQVQAYRGTICEVKATDYLLRRIRGEPQPEVEKARQAFCSLTKSLEDLIQGLWWRDFEILVDLIFSRLGWQRVSVLGKTEKDIDLDLLSPSTQQRAFVQVKSSATRQSIESIIETYKSYSQYHQLFIVVHSSDEAEGLALQFGEPQVHIWGVERVAELVVHSGLVEWLLTKRS